MNDLKNKSLRKKVSNYIAKDVENLYFAYSQQIESEELSKVIQFIIANLEKRYRLNANILDSTYEELITNYTHYRKITPAAYLTAYKKVQS